MPRDILAELDQALEDVRRANLPDYDRRLRDLEKLFKDLREQLAPLLAILRLKGER